MITLPLHSVVTLKQRHHALVLHAPVILSFLTIILLLITVVMTESLLSIQSQRIFTLRKLQQQQQQHTSHYFLKRDPFMDTTTTEKKKDVDQFSVVSEDDDKKNDDDDKNNNNNENQRIKTKKDDDLLTSTSTSSLSTGTVVISTIMFVSFWPLLALLRTSSWNNNPIDGFDIDMFIALKGIMDNTTPDSSMAIGVGLDAAADYNPVIMELPSLSPAEQLVGAFFGPR
mmetsp:Transcript_27214/g.30574  ORF Transcript_27214/g.30574 Transcript_27214/m.30574 type:complete len:228 (-) Transcript_27214:35-718(-)